MRGCFALQPRTSPDPLVRPARAGMFPCQREGPWAFPWSAPHVRGCFWRSLSFRLRPLARPARAGMFRCRSSVQRCRRGSPRRRGDVSHGLNRDNHHELSTPHMRECSSTGGDEALRSTISLHTRGCFVQRGESGDRGAVHPADAGMLREGPIVAGGVGSPRICGGVPECAAPMVAAQPLTPAQAGLSPFPGARRGARGDSLRTYGGLRALPACAGVSRSRRREGWVQDQLPCTCRGVPWMQYTPRSLSVSPQRRGCLAAGELSVG